MWPWKKKKDPSEVAIQAIESIKKQSRAAVHEVKKAGIEVRSYQLDLIERIEADLNKIVKRFSRQIDEILEAHMIRSLDEDVAELGEDVVTDEFADLDSRAVYSRDYKKDPPKCRVLMDGLGLYATPDEARKAIEEHGRDAIKNIVELEEWLKALD